MVSYKRSSFFCFAASMSSSGELVAVLEEWKNRKFRQEDITLTRAAGSLSSSDFLVQALPSPNNRNRWAVGLLLF